jgi:hypothetical protein
MPHDARSLSVRWLPDEAGWRRFEVTSRGDRVIARLHAVDATCPLALVVADDAGAVAPLPGCATVTLDLPLLGRRSSPKWTERLRRCLAQGAEGAADHALLEAFLDQATGDVSAVLDMCAGLPGLGTRAGLLGLGAGALVAARMRGAEPRLAAFVLAPAGLAASLAPRASLAGGGGPSCPTARDAAEGAARLREALA